MVKLPITGTLDEPIIHWTAMREDWADLFGQMRERVEEAPAAAAILGGLEGLADGKADEAVTAAVDLIRELRQRRQANAAAEEAPKPVEPESTSKPSDDSADQSRPRPVRDALKNIFRKKTQ